MRFALQIDTTGTQAWVRIACFNDLCALMVAKVSVPAHWSRSLVQPVTALPAGCSLPRPWLACCCGEQYVRRTVVVFDVCPGSHLPCARGRERLRYGP